ncbi:hypothetical protein BUALT_Bualt03G0101400 [Buddleja alternifolia]|uniref:25S rRNA (uridine-N(3))-methyltransferase BMT5-like domain-containing protein n=1 Tax=Buddleja alternifolia TaxID=168488 RepID=A0AAV6XSU5_9LAMI|nr:hypothetical protein BUALT_Bualt03G0101400 [Buddleja alternifolia]
MGIFNSIIRFLGGKTDELDEESDLINPYPLLTRRQNNSNNNNYYYYNSSSNGEYSSSSTASFERLRKILCIHKFIYNGSKKLLQKLRNIFFHHPDGKSAAERPILPLKLDVTAAPPARIISSNIDPLLLQTLLISSPTTTHDHLNADDLEEFQNDNSDHVVVPEKEINNYTANNVQMDDVIISIPDFTHSVLAPASTASEEVIEAAVFRAPQINAPNCLNMISTISEKDEEKVMLKSIITTVEAEDKEEKVINVNSSSVRVVVDEGIIRWIKHSSCLHRILLVGDGDFSFSASLPVAVGCASNMIATSLDPQGAQEEINDNSDNYVMQMDDRVIISIPEFNHPLTDLSAFDVRRGSIVLAAPQNVPNCLISTVSEEEEKMDKEEEKVIIVKSSVVMVDEGIRWIKDYSSRQRILLVGEGDFSFSASLAVAFGCASNMIATSLDPEAFLKKNYQKFLSNIKKLRSRGCKVMHEIDATKMASHQLLGHLTFDRIIYNFPYAGFFKMSREDLLWSLVSQFLENAKEMISENGEIHITHMTNAFHREWNLEDVASSHGIKLIDAVKFNHRDYPGYNTKYGFGAAQAEISARLPRYRCDGRDITDPAAISPLPIRPTTIPALAWNDGTGMAVPVPTRPRSRRDSKP